MTSQAPTSVVLNTPVAVAACIAELALCYIVQKDALSSYLQVIHPHKKEKREPYFDLSGLCGYVVDLN